MHKSVSRDHLISLAERIQDAQDLGEDYSALLAELQEHLPYPEVGDLFFGDYSADCIVDFSLKWQAEWPKLSRAEMTDLVTKICKVEGTQAEQMIMIEIFDANCRHPAKNGLIFYPDEYFGGNSNPTPEEIVDKAMGL